MYIQRQNFASKCLFFEYYLRSIMVCKFHSDTILKGEIYAEILLIHLLAVLAFFFSWQQAEQSKFMHNQAAHLALPFWW